MLHLNIEKSKAGKELINMGIEIGMEKGIEKGIEKGKKEGKKEGKKKGLKMGSLLKTREMLLCALEEKFGGIPKPVETAIKQISQEKRLNDLFKKTLHCQTIEEFTASMKGLKSF